MVFVFDEEQTLRCQGRLSEWKGLCQARRRGGTWDFRAAIGCFGKGEVIIGNGGFTLRITINSRLNVLAG